MCPLNKPPHTRETMLAKKVWTSRNLRRFENKVWLNANWICFRMWTEEWRKKLVKVENIPCSHFEHRNGFLNCKNCKKYFFYFWKSKKKELTLTHSSYLHSFSFLGIKQKLQKMTLIISDINAQKYVLNILTKKFKFKKCWSWQFVLKLKINFNFYFIPRKRRKINSIFS